MHGSCACWHHQHSQPKEHPQLTAWHICVGAGTTVRERLALLAGQHSLWQPGAARHIVFRGTPHHFEYLLQGSRLILACTQPVLSALCLTLRPSSFPRGQHPSKQESYSQTTPAAMGLHSHPCTSHKSRHESKQLPPLRPTAHQEQRHTWKQRLAGEQLKHNAASAPHVHLRPITVKPQEQLRRPTP